MSRLLKVATWNVNSIRSRLERLILFLRRSSVDILCLQELKCTEEQFPWSELSAEGYQSFIFGQKSYNGVAILVKNQWQVDGVSKGFLGGEDLGARYIEIILGKLRIGSVYAVNGQEVGSIAYQNKLLWFKKLQEYLVALNPTESHFILSGDFNVAPTEMDVYSPNNWEGERILVSTEERRAMQQLFNLGFIDSLREHHKKEKIFSWWDYRQLSFPMNKGLRIDLILNTLPMHALCKSHFIDREERKGSKPSDHAPVIAEFDYQILT